MVANAPSTTGAMQFVYPTLLNLTQLNADGIKALASMPSLDELRAKIVGLVNAPATKVAQLVNAPAAKLARVFGAYAAKEAA